MKFRLTPPTRRANFFRVVIVQRFQTRAQNCAMLLARGRLPAVKYRGLLSEKGLFGHVARLRSDVPANQILRICTKTRERDRPSQEWRRASGRPPTTWIHQICRDTSVTATEALQLAEDRPFWRTIATAGGFG